MASFPGYRARHIHVYFFPKYGTSRGVSRPRPQGSEKGFLEGVWEQDQQYREAKMSCSGVNIGKPSTGFMGNSIKEPSAHYLISHNPEVRHKLWLPGLQHGHAPAEKHKCCNRVKRILNCYIYGYSGPSAVVYFLVWR